MKLVRPTAMAGTLCLALLTLALSSCASSPEAKSAKFMAAGKKLLQKKDAERAILQFQGAAQATPRNPEVYYQLGTAYIAVGDWAKGVAHLRRAVELNPHHTAALLLIAKLMSYSDQSAILKEAQERLNALVQDTPEDPQVLQTLATTELKLGDVDDAIQHLDHAMLDAPQEQAIAVTLAQAKLLQNDAKGAEEVLKKASENSPKSANIVVILGRFYLSQNRAAEAEERFRRALEMDSTNADALLNLAILQNRTGRKQEAEQNFARLAALPGKTYNAAHAIFLFQEGRRDEAVREFEKLFNKDPADRLSRTRLVAAYYTMNRAADAGKVLAQALKQNPKDSDALLQRSELSLATGKYEQAEVDLNQVFQLQPNSAVLHYIKAHLNRARGQASTYRQELSETLRLDPYLLAARLESARVFEDSNDGRAVVSLLKETPPSQRDALAVIIERNWGFWILNDLPAMRKGIDQGLSRAKAPDLLLQDGLWKLRSGNLTGARIALEAALKINPTDIRALNALKVSYAAAKQDAKGLKEIEKYVAMQPKSAPLQEYLGFQLMTEKDQGGAIAAFTAAQAADPRYTAAELPLALLDVANHKTEDAVAKLRAVLAADGGNVKARLLLGKIQERQGNHEDALDQFQKVVDQDANNAEGLNNLAYLLSEYRNQTNEALKDAQKAQELAPDNPEYADTLGWILYRKGLYPSAITQLGRAASHEGNAIWKYHLAMAYVKAGDLRRGRSMLDIALKANPNLPEAKIAREMVEANK